MTRVLCVAEKPSIAKAVANHLGGQARAVGASIVSYNTILYPYSLHLCFISTLMAKSTAKVFVLSGSARHQGRDHLLVLDCRSNARLTPDRKVSEVFSGSRTTSSTFAFNPGGNVL